MNNPPSLTERLADWLLAEEQLAVNPSYAETQQVIARYFAMEGARDDALQHLETALRLAPTDIDVLQAAAHVYATLHEPERAIEYLLQAIEAGYPRAEIKVDPVFTELGEDPRLLRALEEAPR